MSFSFNGMVLRGATNGGTNAKTTALSTSGVLRDIKVLDTSYDLSSHAPDAIDLHADCYRTSMLNSPNQDTSEYYVWASNTGRISTIVGDINNGSDPYLKLDAVEIDFSGDGKTLIVFQLENLAIDSIFGVLIKKDNTKYLLTSSANPTGYLYDNDYLVTDAFDPSDLESGVLRVKQTVLDAHFGGAFDANRDEILETIYFLAPVKFFWSRNDTYQKRFYFDYRVQSWRLIKGSHTMNLGVVNLGTKYKLSPTPQDLVIGSYLEGSTVSDKYSMLRVGRLPNSGSLPLAEDALGDFNGVLVVQDEEVTLEYDFSAHSPQPFAVIGSESAEMIFNPLFVIEKSGQNVWYSYQDFVEDSDGVIGSLETAGSSPLFISPIPKRFERPFIKIGTRRYLSPLFVDNDADLSALTISSEREFGISLSTGQLKFHSDLIAKANSTSGSFDKNYLGAQVYYDGVSLNKVPQPMRDPVPLVNSGGSITGITKTNNGKVYIPLADPYASNGLGSSGVLHVPDGSGVPFDLSVTTDGDAKVGIRQGGDSDSETAGGLVREVIPRALGIPSELSLGDSFIFTSKATIDLKVVDKKSSNNLTEMTKFDFKMKGSVAEVTREGLASLPDGFGSAVKLSANARKSLGTNETVYFIQSIVTPSIYTDKAEIVTKNRVSFTFEVGDLLVFAVDGVGYSWQAGVTTYTTEELLVDLVANAEEISSGLNNLNTTTLSLENHFGHVLLRADTSLEIGFGLNGVKDLSACAVLGVNPSWRAVEGQENWLIDSGVSFGFERSPLNKDGSELLPDFHSLYRLVDQRVSPVDGLSAQSVLFLDYAPLEDVAGFDENVFFQSITYKKVNNQLFSIYTYLNNYEDLVHKFGERYIMFIEDYEMDQARKIENKTSDLLLGATQMIEETFYASVPDSSYGLFLNDGFMGLTYLNHNLDYVMDATSGIAQLITKYGDLFHTGFLGTWTASSDTFINEFETTDSDFLERSVSIGDKLKILSGDEEGYRIVEEVVDGDTLRVSPPFLTANGDYPVAWELYSGIDRNAHDPSLVADISYTEFNHLSYEPIDIRLLSPLGEVSGSNEFTIDLGDSLDNDHSIFLRYGKDGDNQPLYQLEVEKIGTLANQSLFLTLTDRISNDKYWIQLDTDYYLPIKVADVDWASYVFDENEIYLNSDTGELFFGDLYLNNYSNADVYYRDDFQDPADITTAEFDAFSGVCNISESNRLANLGVTLYFVQELNTSGNTDLVCNPIGGSVYFLNPLKENRIVEIDYNLADDIGDLLLDDEGDIVVVNEQLPVFVIQEEATFVENNKFSINPTSKTISSSVGVHVWVDGFRCNYGTQNCEVIDDLLYFSLTEDVTSDSKVLVSYAVFESFGGEQVYKTSMRPLHRPSFFIEQDTDSFVLDTDRSSDLKVGMLLRLGADNFYLKSVVYDSEEDTTTVTIFPPTVTEVGSRSPNNEVLTLLSSEPIAHVVDPDDPQATESEQGFLRSIDSLIGSTVVWQGVNRGQNKIEFQADITKYAVGGHILEIGGVPYTIAQSTVSEDGFKTIVEVTSTFYSGYSMAEDSVKISVRPIYPPNATAFLGKGSVLDTLNYSLILFGETGEAGNKLAGRELVEGVHYQIDVDTGNVVFLSPLQAPFQANQSLYLNFTRKDFLEPALDLRTQTYLIPKYFVKTKVVSTPSDDNLLLGATILTRNTFYSPDSFYTRIVPLVSYSAETVQRLSSFNDTNPQGPISSVEEDPQSYDKGVVGLMSERSNITDDDRSAKLYLEFYNSVVNSFEQVTETITGALIGDRDGKFRFFVGRDKEVAPQGYECPITGLLNPFNVWGAIFESESGFAFDIGDDLLDPRGASLTSAEVSGSDLNQETYEKIATRQRIITKNDIDDVLLVSRGRFNFSWFNVSHKGIFLDGSNPSIYSRLFPEQTKTFFLTYQGLESDLSARGVASSREDWSGWYSFSRTMQPIEFSFDEGLQTAIRGSTHKKEIALVSNPVLGHIQNIEDIALSRRYPRARIFAYFAEGVEANAFGTGFPSTGITKPCLIATPLELSKFPVNPVTGFPDLTSLVANGGDLADLTTGDPELRTPAFSDFEITKQVAFGFPNGDTLVPVFSEDSESGIYIDEILYGCLITFIGGSLTTPTDIIESDMIVDVDTNGNPNNEVSLERGDTLYLISPTNSIDFDSLNDPPTAEEIESLKKLPNAYNSPFDVIVDKKNGILKDRSFLNHTKDGDKWFSGAWFGQNPPLPMSELEGEVNFTYPHMSFLEIPALKGEPKNDHGDYSIPYLRTELTERDRFGEISRLSSSIMTTISPSGYYVYPDEIRGDDGEILDSVFFTRPPSALTTVQRHNPHSFQTSAVGKNDVESYDFLLIEYRSDTAIPELPVAVQGICEVGKVYRDEAEVLLGFGTGSSTYSCVEIPRFKTTTGLGSAHRYSMTNAMVHIHDDTPWDWTTGEPPNGIYSPANTSGVVIHEDIDPVDPKLVLDFSSLGQIELADGTGNGVGSANPFTPSTWGGQGGFNRIFGGGTTTEDNQIQINIFAREKTTSGVITRDPHAGDLLVTLTIKDNGNTLDILYTDGSVSTITLTSTVFGTYDSLQQSGSLDDFKCITMKLPAPVAMDFANHTEIPRTLNSTIYSTDYAFDFSISVYATTSAGKGSITAQILEDRLTFSESYDLRYSRPRNLRHPVGYQYLETSLFFTSVESKDYYGADQQIPVDNFMQTYSFVERGREHLDPIPDVGETHFGIGTFTEASLNDEGDERSTIRVMSFEGVSAEADLFSDPPIVTFTVEDIDDNGDTFIDRFGVITRIEVTDQGGAIGLEGRILVIISDAFGYGAIAEAPLDSNGDLPLGDLVILNGGRSYSTPTITFIHDADNIPILSEDITFSMIPSSPENETGIIADGTIRMFSKHISTPLDTILQDPTLINGSIQNIEKGDTVVIRGSAKTSTYNLGGGGTIQTKHASNISGSYLIRTALENNLFGSGNISVDLGGQAHSVFKKANTPNNNSWVSLTFPKVTEVDQANTKVTIDKDPTFSDSPSGHYYGAKHVIKTLSITGGGTGFTESDIGRTFSVSGGTTSCVIEIVAINYGTGEVTEVALRSRGTGYTSTSPYTTNLAPIGVGTDAVVDASSTQEQDVFFILNNGAESDTYALKCPFTSISSDEIVLDTSTLGSVASKIYYGAQVLDNSFPLSINLYDGTVEILSNYSELETFFWGLLLDTDVGGHKYLPINLRKNSQSDRYVGKRYVRNTSAELVWITAQGFLALTFENSSGEWSFVSPYVNGIGSSYILDEGGRDGAIRIASKYKTLSTTFLEDKDSLVYDDIPVMLDLQAISDDPTNFTLIFYQLHNNAQCFVSGDFISTRCDDYSTKGTVGTKMTGDFPNKEGFIAKEGIYVEPSWRQPAGNYLFDNQRVVSNTAPSVYTSTIGFHVLATSFDEEVTFQVRRTRRFHEIQTNLQGSVQPLRYAYEIRRGVPTDYSTNHKGVGVLSADGFVFQNNNKAYEKATKTYVGTQLGSFDNENVNIVSGDTVRLLFMGEVVDTAEILRLGEFTGGNIIDKDSKISLKAPAFTDADFLSASNYEDYSFEIYLRNATVPHEQSNEELLDLITDQVVLKTTADPASQLGGYVPHIPLLSQTGGGLGEINPDTSNPKTWADYINILYDDLNAPNTDDFLNLGVQEGDIVLVDSMGLLQGATGVHFTEERGSRPFGDFGIEERLDFGLGSTVGRDAYLIGGTSPLDDNRGFFTVSSVEEDHLVLQSGYSNDYVGEYENDVVFPEDIPSRSEIGFTIYPTVHDSNLHNGNYFAISTGIEGQMDLRPTQYAGILNDGTVDPNPNNTNSFAVNDFSIRPFSYKVIRPSSLFSAETIEFILMMRERILSLMDHFRAFMLLDKGGDYYDFQKNQHIEDIGTPTIAETGLGVYHNAYLEDILGRVDVAPFCNDSDALSLLDRRFMIQDSELDLLCPDNTGVGSGLVSDLGGTPYTALEDDAGFYSGVDGFLVRPLMLDQIDIVLNDRDRFRDLRSTWIEYRTHRTEGLLAKIRQFDSEIADKLKKQDAYYLRLKSQK